MGALSRFSAKPTYNACCLLTHLLQYLNGNPECKIIFSQGDWNLHGFSDADWAGYKLTRRSTGDFIIFVMGGPIAWQSKLMLIVAKSSMESEYMALFHGLQEVVWTRGVLKELKLLNVLVDGPTPWLIDSQSAKDLAENPVYHKRSKHIDILWHWLRQIVDPEGIRYEVKLHHCTTEMMTADVLTKTLVGALFNFHSERISGKNKNRDVNEVIKLCKKKKSRYK